MKKIISLLLALSLALSLAACGGTQKQIDTGDAPETTVLEMPTEEPATAPKADPVSESNLFLTVSSITFSLVGEQEDIYLGLVPRELVTWESEDPSVVSVENGVLTAVGVGTTTVRASYDDRQVSCTAGCLAETQEALDSLDPELLCAPKRLPPEVDLEAPCTYFDNAAIVGDSITFILFQHESKSNYLGDMLFLAKGGVSMNGFVRRYKNISYKGQPMNLEDAIAQSGVQRVYFLMGSNDIAEPSQRAAYFDNWDTMLERIRAQSPDVEIVIISNLPQYDASMRPQLKNANIEAYNARMVEYNEKLKTYAGENGCLYLDLSRYVQDHYGRMPKLYSQDSYHLNEAGCVNWMKVLRFYAQYESEGGTIS